MRVFENKQLLEDALCEQIKLDLESAISQYGSAFLYTVCEGLRFCGLDGNDFLPRSEIDLRGGASHKRNPSLALPRLGFFSYPIPWHGCANMR
jgi:hypothetical protein